MHDLNRRLKEFQHIAKNEPLVRLPFEAMHWDVSTDSGISESDALKYAIVSLVEQRDALLQSLQIAESKRNVLPVNTILSRGNRNPEKAKKSATLSLVQTDKLSCLLDKFFWYEDDSQESGPETYTDAESIVLLSKARELIDDEIKQRSGGKP